MNSPFSASSRSPRPVNFDGSTSIFCHTCNQFICRSTIRMGSAKCELCRRFEAGEALTPEILTAYELSKAPYKDVTDLAVREEIKNEPNPRHRTIRTMGHGILVALGIKKTEEELRPPPSKEISRDKKVGPLFGEEDLK